MKFFTLIFSFYLLGLSCLPCGDTDECNVKSGLTASTPINHEKHTHENENCTPLCHCSCCASSVCFQLITSYKIPYTVFQSAKFPVYEILYSSQVSFSIWQPPKLS